MDEIDSSPFEGIFSPRVYDLLTSPPRVLPQQFNETQAPPVLNSIVSHATTPVNYPAASPGRPGSGKHNRANRTKLPRLRLEEWDKHYNEDPPTCMHYSIEWQVTLNGKEVLRDTEPDLVLNPAAHWELFLQRRVQALVQHKGRE
jgi:hypothetical protein